MVQHIWCSDRSRCGRFDLGLKGVAKSRIFLSPAGTPHLRATEAGTSLVMYIDRGITPRLETPPSRRDRKPG